MSKRNLKRVAVGSQEAQFFDAEAKFRLKHQDLLQDFLELQKDFVSNKKKLQIAQDKRGILLTEVQFLRRRLTYLMKEQSKCRQVEEQVPSELPFTRGNAVGEALTVEKQQQLQSCLMSNQKFRKKKLSWKDQVESGI